MKMHATPPRSYEFAFPQLDTLVRVDQAEDLVLIRATRDTFSSMRKESFIHELAAEGFIDDGYQSFSATEAHPACPLRWRIDVSWLKLDAEQAALTRRFVFRLFGGAVLLWLSLMVMIFMRAAG
jgi:hypothetical protein